MVVGKASRRGSQSAAPSKKRSRDEMDKINGQLTGTQIKPVNLDDYQGNEYEKPEKAIRAKKSKPQLSVEKRLRKVRSRAPIAWQERLERAINQRMFLLERERRDDGDIPQEIFELAGSTGNVYYVTIKQVPDCTCPDSCNGNICKHIIYVLRLILRAPPDIEFQSAFLVSELKQIFENSPEVEHTSDHDHADEIHRKPVDDHCPVCFTGFEAHEDIIWCKAACGNNIHKECFRQWARSNQGKQVCCVYCRSVWKEDEPSLESIRASKEGKAVNGEGYVNIASELGIPTHRESSSYHSFWV